MSARTRRACACLSVAGSLLLMAGVTLGLTWGLLGLPRGWHAAPAAAWGLAMCGMAFGGITITISAPVAPGAAPERQRTVPVQAVPAVSRRHGPEAA